MDMRQLKHALPLLLLLALSAATDARRVRVRPRPVEEDVPVDQEQGGQQVQYYAAQPQDEVESAGVVLVRQDPYGGLYGGGATARASTAGRAPVPRVKESKQPPAQTIRNYSKVNDDGSFTFGYESDDGSFKEETRGTDCVVRGKYGYVDPDGNKREFTYVSGNPCDPNNPSGAEEEEHSVQNAAEDSGEENVPKGPIRPLRPLRPVAPARPTTTFFQQSYNQGDEAEEEQEEHQQLLTYRPQPTARPVIRTQPAIRITPRPLPSTTASAQLPATTYRPLLQVSVTPRPGIVYSHSTPATLQRPTPTPAGPVDFDAELKKFQLENSVVTTARSPIKQQNVVLQPQRKAPSGDPIYDSQLVYDPASGQYNTVLYQQIPKTTSSVSLNHRLQPFVHQPQTAYQRPQSVYQQPQSAYHQPQSAYQQPQSAYQQPQSAYQQPQSVYQQPQSAYQVPQSVYQQQSYQQLQQSQQLYAQQQQIRQQQQQQQQQQQHRFQPSATTAPTTVKASPGPQRYQIPAPYYQQEQQQQQRPAQGFYYVQSGGASHSNSLSHGQIDSFLRGHNLPY